MRGGLRRNIRDPPGEKFSERSGEFFGMGCDFFVPYGDRTKLDGLDFFRVGPGRDVGRAAIQHGMFAAQGFAGGKLDYAL